MSGSVWKKPPRIPDFDVQPSQNTARAEHGEKSRQEPPDARKIETTQDSGESSKPPAGRSNGRKGASYKVDLREENSTSRFIQFSTRITEELNDSIREYCVQRKRGMKITQRYGLGEFLEDALESLKRDRKNNGAS